MSLELITDIAVIKKMRGSELLAYARDVLFDRAARIAIHETDLIRMGQSGWHSENAPAHDAICGAALALEIILAIGKDEGERIALEKKEGKNPRPMNKAVESVINAVRSEIISQMMKRAPKETGGTDANEA